MTIDFKEPVHEPTERTAVSSNPMLSLVNRRNLPQFYRRDAHQTMPSENDHRSVQNDRTPDSILVADSDRANLKTVSSIIEQEGLNVLTATDGREARRILQSNSSIIAAIFEVVLPHMSGPDLIRFMKHDERFKDLPVIIMTRMKNSRFSTESLAIGARALLPEPFTANQLRSLLHLLINPANQVLRKAS